MNKLQRDILYRLRENKKSKGMTPSQLAMKLNKNQKDIEIELGILAENNLIEAESRSRGKIKRAVISTQGEDHLKKETSIATKKSVEQQINELKTQILSLETALEQLSENPNEDNKKTLLEKLDTCQSIANGIPPLITAVKSGIDFIGKVL